MSTNRKRMNTQSSYSKHQAWEKNQKLENRLPAAYSNPNSIDAWRHDRMRGMVDPLIKSSKKNTWITIGDGNFGSDAHYIENEGLDVVASSISDETISVAYELGYIKKYKEINAENILEKDEAYDYVFCKEAFHHFPRPFVGLYEMLRVAKKGVVLIEPQEGTVRVLDILKKGIKKVWRKDESLQFESSGNFIYRINLKEISKAMIAMNYKYLAYLRFNDFYAESVSSKPNKDFSKAKITFSLALGVQNLLCKLRLMDYGLAAVILFKDNIESNLLKDLKSKGFHIEQLPINPYL